MKALVTGASSGIGFEMVKELSKRGFQVIAIARRANRLKELQEICDSDIKIIVCDLSKNENCKALYEYVKDENVDILINNAGFGDYGLFHETNLNKEIQMIRTNIEALHILTKLFLKDFVKRDSGYILNVASSAAFLPGPLMATYYASKVYVYHLTLAIQKELEKEHSCVSVSVLCPGPVPTEFNDVANVNFAISGASKEMVAKYAIRQMWKKKKVIIPTMMMKMGYIASRLTPRSILLSVAYHIQHAKNN